MLLDGEIGQEKYDAMRTGIEQLQATAANAQKAAAGSLTTGEATAWGGGITTAVLGALRIWRGKPSKGLSKSIQNVAANANG